MTQWQNVWLSSTHETLVSKSNENVGPGSVRREGRVIYRKREKKRETQYTPTSQVYFIIDLQIHL